MKNFSHADQQRIWDAEHERPNVLLQMDADTASSGVIKFWEFIKEKNVKDLKGLEMGCGKGRNVIWLTQQGVKEMQGFDFSPSAITEAKKRATLRGTTKAIFNVQDATEDWKYDSNYFDFGIDCFASTDIESKNGREFAAQEMHRVIKPGGYLLAYLLSTDDEFHKKMIGKMPAEEQNAFHHPTGKFEKVFDEGEVKDLYKNFDLVKWERVEKTAKFNGEDYNCKHFWVVFQKSGDR